MTWILDDVTLIDVHVCREEVKSHESLGHEFKRRQERSLCELYLRDRWPITAISILGWSATGRGITPEPLFLPHNDL